MTDARTSLLPAEFFYDELAADYDTMTGFQQRFQREETAFREIVREYTIRTALDVGCGTGFHSLLLARLGVNVTALDISPSMTERTKQHAAKMNLPVRVVVSDLLQLPERKLSPFDAVFCLGNTLPHLRSSTEVRAALANFRSLLVPEGLLVLQMLNYNAILTQRQRIINIKEIGRKTFIRFHDFLEDSVIFNILTLTRTGKGIEHTLNSTALRPITTRAIMAALAESGFDRTRLYGSVMQDAYSESAKDIVVFTHRCG